MFSFRGISPKCSAFKSNSHNAYRFCSFVQAIPTLVTPCLTNEMDWERGGWGRGMLENAREDARFAASASKQTQTKGFEVPHVLRDFRKRARTTRRCLISPAQSPFPEKKDAEIARVCKTRVLFQSRRRRLKRAGILFRSCKSIGVILGFFTSKWMSRFIIKREDQKEGYLHFIRVLDEYFKSAHNYFLFCILLNN